MDESSYRYPCGAVYIFENVKAQRVKVGMTILSTTNVLDRLRDLNNIWIGLKATCQVCGGRRFINTKGLVPQHVVSGVECPGGDRAPIEREVVFAEQHLQNLKKLVENVTGTEKGSVTRKINSLEKRVKLFRHYNQPLGMWQISTVYHTERAELVESETHQILVEKLDKLAPIGEVFCCSVSEASKAVELALKQLGLLDAAEKEINIPTTSGEYGQCVICGNNLTATGACPDCRERLLS
ncbi:hypothetical protein [Methylophaga thiooxydans]|uniref:Uncharacterized protein n=1 Tax=Methylophaga thiooxydans DMS010 TaxID=637616 RepID=C0N620_9GAMM|nr:hypothetical protein [Methylophaga thiooxydans]EEF79808.1 hypothetical protein MDMS009_1359 [Methylophaga thiooxydans DMS010]